MPLTREPASPHQQPAENSRHGRLTVRLCQPLAAFTRAGLLRFEGPAGQLVGVTLGELPDRPLLLGPGVPLRGARKRPRPP